MKKPEWAKSLALNAALTAAVWAGCAYQVEGALNVARFVIWAVFLPLCALMLMGADEAAKKASAYPAPPRLFVAARWLMNAGALGVLVWFGFIVTAAALMFILIVTAAVRDKAGKLRREAAEGA